jgi:hypothetical protein
MSLFLLLDEHLSPVVAAQVQAKQPAVVIRSVHHWRGGDLLGQDDGPLLAAAAEEALTLVTYDQKTIAPLLVELARRTVRPASRPESPEETSWWLSLGSALRIEDPPAPRTATGHEAHDGQAGTSRPLVRTPDPPAPAPAET